LKYYNVITETSSCDDVQKAVCNDFKNCRDACYAKYSTCGDEHDDYNACELGAALIPENCVAQCSGISGGSNGSNSAAPDMRVATVGWIALPLFLLSARFL
jgi:hypothetical protein